MSDRILGRGPTVPGSIKGESAAAETEPRGSRLIAMSEDDIRLHRPARARYVHVLQLLQHPRRPSQRVRTEDLANVVCGREDVPLPAWASDRAFERELEDLIAESASVWICVECDSVVGFFNLETGADQDALLRDLLLVHRSEAIRCPFCSKHSILLAKPTILTKGIKVLAPPVEPQREQKTPQSPGPPKVEGMTEGRRANELYLAGLTAKVYQQTSDVMVTSDQNGALDHFSNTVARWEGVDAKEKRPELEARLSESHLQSGIPLRPIWGTEGNNVLGRVWDSVRLLVADVDARVGDIAVGVVKRPGLSARSHLGPSGEMAIAVDFGVFDWLYHVNHLLNLLYFSSDRPKVSLETIGDNLVTWLARGSGRRSTRVIEAAAYADKNEFWRAHLTTNAQQQFILLHEVGHLCGGVETGGSALADRADPHAYLANEVEVDAWAVRRIIAGGDAFYEARMQFRAIAWLFEYWHMIQSIEWIATRVGPRRTDSRLRWDRIAATWKQSGGSPERLGISALRTFVDDLVEQIEERS